MKLVRIIMIMLLPWIGWSQNDPEDIYPYPSSPPASTNINAAEYFIDEDPGFGNGTAISITTPGLDLTFSNINLDISGLAEGLHVLFIRTQNLNLEWSQSTSQTFVIEPNYQLTPPALSNITNAEYYFNEDPGFGEGTPIPVTSGLDLSLVNQSLDISSLPTGVHTIFLRTQDANGNWSNTSNRTILKEPDYNPTPALPGNIVAAEYFTSGSGLGGDPGLGLATPITIPSGQTDLSLTDEPLSIVGLANGINYAYLRTQNADGEWSQTSIQEFTIVNDPVYPSAPPTPADVIAAEYYFDDDPGFGSGTSIPVTSGQDISLSNIGLDLSGLGNGIHFAFLRTQNADGEWSQSSSREFEIVNDPVYPAAPASPTNIVAAEYYFDDDPGFGSGTNIPIPSGQDTSLSNLSLDVSALGQGIHYVFIRTQNADGEWSQTSSREFEVVLDFAYPPAPPAPGDVVAAEYFFDTDPGFGNGTDVSALTSGLDISLADIPVDISGLNPGTHNLFLRTQNSDNEWSQTSQREFTILDATDCTATTAWDGSTWSNGVPDASTKAIINADFTVTTDSEWCKLQVLDGTFTIDQSAKLTLNDTFDAIVLDAAGNLEVEGIVSSAGNILNDGSIQFKSTSAETGQIDVFTASINGTGDVTVERYIPAKRAFRLLSSSVTTIDFIYENWQQNGLNPGDSGYVPRLGTQITGGSASLGFDQSGSNNPSMFTFNNTFVPTGAQTQFDAWTALSNTNATKLHAEKPYLTMVRGDRSIDLTNNSDPATETTLRATGVLFTGPSSPVLSSESGFYSLVANPYQAVVDYSLVLRTDLTDFIYVWDASIAGDNGRGGYATVDVSGNTIPPNPFSSDASKFIAPGMSFFVQNLSDGNLSPDLTFNEVDKATEENQVTVFNNYPYFYINSRLYLTSDLQNGNSERDATGLRFSDSYTTTGSDEDATKLGNPGENFAILNNGLRSIDKQGLPAHGHVVNFSITNYTESDYSLTFSMGNKPSDLNVLLNDAYTNRSVELSESFVYDFTVDPNIPESLAFNRFSLEFENSILGITDNQITDNFRLHPNPSADGKFSISIKRLEEGEANVEIFNVLGQKVYSQNLRVENNDNLNVNANNLASGLYAVKVYQDQKSYAGKLIIE